MRRAGCLNFVALLLITLIPNNGYAADDIRLACTDLVLDYAYYRDLGDADTVANLFAENARLEVLGEVWNGRRAIHERLSSSPEDAPVLRHAMSTIRIFPGNDGRATGVSYVTVYSSEPGAELPAAVSSFAAVGEYHDEFVATPDGWKIAQRTFVPVFMAPAPAP